MINFILVFIVCLALVMSIFIGIYALFRTQSYKRSYFLLMQVMIIVYLFGYLLELTSTNSGEAYTAVKVVYLGAYFIPVFAFFFLADYCNIKINLFFVKIPMVVLALVPFLVMATSKFHNFLYFTYSSAKEFGQPLGFTPGTVYSLIHSYPLACMVASMVILIYQLKKWADKYRIQLYLFLVCIAIPFLAEMVSWVIIVAGLYSHYIYVTPYSMAIMSFFLYLGVMRFNVFEIISMATITAIDHIREGFILVDESNNYLSSNPTTAMMFPGVTKLRKGESIFLAADWPEAIKNAASTSVDFSLTGETARYFTASVSPIYNNRKVLMAKIILFKETTDSVNLMKELESAAYIDSLTGLYNRKHFTELAFVDIERALRLDQSIYAAMLDLDFFKQVNDTYGHAAGDMVLKSTAGIIRQTIRSYDLLCRYGGEEFVLLLTALDEVEAYKLVERIRENMEHSAIMYEEDEIRITCSIGLAEFLETDTLDSAVKKADEALYAAKNSGRNRVKIHSEL